MPHSTDGVSDRIGQESSTRRTVLKLTGTTLAAAGVFGSASAAGSTQLVGVADVGLEGEIDRLLKNGHHDRARELMEANDVAHSITSSTIPAGPRSTGPDGSIEPQYWPEGYAEVYGTIFSLSSSDDLYHAEGQVVFDDIDTDETWGSPWFLHDHGQLSWDPGIWTASEGVVDPAVNVYISGNQENSDLIVDDFDWSHAGIEAKLAANEDGVLDERILGVQAELFKDGDSGADTDGVAFEYEHTWASIPYGQVSVSYGFGLFSLSLPFGGRWSDSWHDMVEPEL